jgi:hypothetical protein
MVCILWISLVVISICLAQSDDSTQGVDIFPDDGPVQRAEGDIFIGRALERGGGAFGEAMDRTVALSSGTLMASKNKRCFASMEALMIRNNIPTTASELRHNLTDAELLRIGLLASIALISPWDQHPLTGRLLISDRGVLLEAYHPSTSESDIMLCVVCALLGIIIMFHVGG